MLRSGIVYVVEAEVLGDGVRAFVVHLLQQQDSRVAERRSIFDLGDGGFDVRGKLYVERGEGKLTGGPFTRRRIVTVETRAIRVIVVVDQRAAPKWRQGKP